MSKAKKLSLSGNDPQEKFIYKPKDLVWAKMKGFTPWPAMIVEPPLDLLSQTRRANSRCVFFFGSRNFAWIEENNIKPFEGPWKEELAKVAKPASFRHAIADINKYMINPTELDTEIDESCGIRSPPTEADFDKVRDGLTGEDDEEEQQQQNATVVNNDDGAEAIANTDEHDAGIGGAVNNGDLSASTSQVVPHVVGSPDEYDIATGGITPPAIKSPVKRSPKAKSNAGAVPKSKSSASKPGTKRRASQNPGSKVAKRKRNGSSELATSSDYDCKASPSLIAARVKIEELTSANAASSSARRANNTIALLNRPVVTRPELPAIDMTSRSQKLIDRNIIPTDQTIGFLGIGIMGATIVKDLLFTGHKVVIWNRTAEKCKPFEENGAEVRSTPMDVVEAADIIFCCVSDPKGAKELVFGNCGVLQVHDLRNKAYVEMSTVDPETSLDIGEAIKHCNGRYMEAQLNGSRQEALDGMLIILAGGDRTVFEECHSCFKTIAKNTFFLGEIGNACKVNLILQTIQGVSLVGLSEALALADRFSISLKDIIDIFELTSMKSNLLLAKGKEMAKGDFNPQQPLSHMQRDLRLVLSMAENLDQAMPVTSIANEVFKHTKRLGYSEHDSSAVFVRSRF